MFTQVKIGIIFSLLLFILSISGLTTSSNSIKLPTSPLFNVNSSDYYIETFESTANKDDLYTTADGWGSGDISLPESNLTLSRIEIDKRDIVINGDLVFIGGGDGTFVYNISDPSLPVFISSNTSVEFRINRFFLLDGYLFTASGPRGVCVIDVSDPTNMEFIKGINDYSVSTLTNINAIHIWVLHEESSSTWYIYIMDDIHGFVSFLFAEPNTLIQTGGYKPIQDTGLVSSKDLHIQEDIAYATYLSSGNLLIMNVSDRVNPSFLYNHEVGIRQMVVQDDLIYGGTGASGSGMVNYGYFKILNISDLSSPYFMYTSSNLNHNINEIMVRDELVCIGAFIYHDEHIFQDIYEIYNTSDPTNPYIIDTYYSPEIIEDDFFSYWWGVYRIVATDTFWYMLQYNNFFIEDFGRLGQFESNAVVQSTPIFSNDNVLLNSITIVSNATIPVDTSVNYYISVNNGSNWEQVYNNTSHYVKNSGSSLKWRVELSAIDLYKTPTIHSLEIYYSYYLKSNALSFPLNNSLVHNRAPTFEWTSVEEAVTYFLQLDTITTFDSIDLQNISVVGNTYTLIDPLNDGEWYWRVAPIDNEGDIGEFSLFNHFTLDGPPEILSVLSPVNNAFVNSHTPTFRWISSSDTVNHTIQIDTMNTFSSALMIEIDGIVTQNYTLSTGNFWVSESLWYWRVRPYDIHYTAGDYSQINQFTVDTTNPVIDSPEDFEVQKGGSSAEIQWNPSDLNPASYILYQNGTEIENHVWIGDSITHDLSALGPGIYDFNCTVLDRAGNTNSDIVRVKILESSKPVVTSFRITPILSGALIIFIARKKHRRKNML